MERISFSDVWRALSSYDPALWFGAVAAIVVFVFEIVLMKKGIIFSGGEKRLERARKAGHIIPATMIKCRYEDKDSTGKTANRMYIATYEYSALGEVRTARVVTVGMKPPFSISLYYDSHPGKVFSEYDIKPNPLQFLLYVIPILVAIVVMKILGFNA